jgi:hypothetical protein
VDCAAGGHKSVEIIQDFVTNYDHSQWIKHRSSWRYVRHFLTMFVQSRVAGKVFGPTIFVTLVAVAACAAYEYAKVRIINP